MGCENFFKKFYAEIIHFCAKFFLGYKMHPVNKAGGWPPLPLNPTLLGLGLSRLDWIAGKKQKKISTGLLV